ncbi:DUF5776 domain-containing protein [Lentilactobacillus diolivorans]|uniref:DUF5011 domain-containing protein n=2 Tax=Lentilactobacillus diolivorans TaxID=179838 RepID=A0A0R1SQY7_9LACO|nr:DUF5776 domain-containing protein [Lentilactobacillus diolivorans]KRL68632.1 hypothetical protein FC85_GL002451 [Lentilactobacillus diolivorans DSM 14421]GEP24883.1 hypothetical protein LDI01_24760 [Lentilactobacillus diolivorans]
MNTKLFGKKWRFIKLILVAVTFLLFTAVMGRQVSADDTPAMYTYTGPNSPQGVLSDKGIEFNTQLIVNGQSGPYPRLIGTNQSSNAIIDATRVNSISQEVTIKNTTSEAVKIGSYEVFLPRWMNPNSPVVATDQYSSTTQNGLTTRWFSYVDDHNSDPTALRAFNITGTLPAYQEYKLIIPMKIQDPDSVKVNDTFNIGNFFYDPYKEFYSYYRFGKLMTDNDGNSPLDSTGRYLATTRNANGTYNMLPNDIQQHMPKMNANHEIRINNFPSGSNEVDFQNATVNNNTPYYTGALYFIQLDAIKDSVRNVGYSVAVKQGTNPSQLMDYYTYNTIPGATIIDPETGKPVSPGQIDGVGTLYIELRKVVDAHDSTISQGSAWKPADNATILDHNGKPVDLASKDVTVTGKVNSSVPGQYQITYKCGPDNVSKTITVTVKGGNTSGGGSTSGNNNSNQTTNPGETTDTNGSTSVTPEVGNGQVAVKGESVYATKKIGLYKKADFKRDNRVKWYSKAKRINRPQFIVKGYQRDNAGKLRYRVQQYNPYTRKYVKGTKGYITASAKYVIPVYYRSTPKSNKVTVINRKGLNSYRKTSLTQKVTHFKKGALLKVKKVIKYKLATRYQLTNGHYITANKKFVIQK